MPKRPRPSYKDESGSSGRSGRETDTSRVGDSNSESDPNLEPRKKANVPSSIRSSQKAKLEDLDGGTCLISGETDGQCVEVCHILRRREHEHNVGTDGSHLSIIIFSFKIFRLERYKIYFGLQQQISIDSISNLIHCTCRT
jgi:hypothetical protein